MLIRDYWQIAPYQRQGQAVMEQALREAAQSKQDLVDIINIAIQTLSEQRLELPGFTRIERAARQARQAVNQSVHHLRQVWQLHT